MMEKISTEALQMQCAAVTENWQRLQERMAAAAARAGRKREEITLLAASKTVTPEVINHAIGLGLTHIGENRVQELCAKYDQLQTDCVQVHLIGHLQTNKVRSVVDKVQMIQSVDSLHLAQEISRICVKQNRSMEVLLEVNIGGEEQKGGVAPEQLEELCAQTAQLPMLTVRGLMTVPPICAKESEVQKYFSKMYRLFLDKKAKKLDNVYMDCLSMGMSQDYQAAIAAGSTMVRVGSSLFGARAYPPAP
jgi:pyridoxal phosphate enzyme (YggS family)